MTAWARNKSFIYFQHIQIIEQRALFSGATWQIGLASRRRIIAAGASAVQNLKAKRGLAGRRLERTARHKPRGRAGAKRASRDLSLGALNRHAVPVESQTSARLPATKIMPGFELPPGRLLQIADRWK
jgi:hypothetical protein